VAQGIGPEFKPQGGRGICNYPLLSVTKEVNSLTVWDGSDPSSWREASRSEVQEGVLEEPLTISWQARLLRAMAPYLL
jgi:hypothetical protein